MIMRTFQKELRKGANGVNEKNGGEGKGRRAKGGGRCKIEGRRRGLKFSRFTRDFNRRTFPTK